MQERAACDHDEFAAEAEEEMAAFVDGNENAVHQEQQAGATGTLIEEENVKNNPGDQGGARNGLPGLLEFFEGWQRSVHDSGTRTGN